MNTTETTLSPKFYDHAANCRTTSMRYAVARARSEVIAEGIAWTITAQWSGQPAPFFWNGASYDVLALAKQLVNNNIEFVTVVTNDGCTLDRVAIRNRKF